MTVPAIAAIDTPPPGAGWLGVGDEVGVDEDVDDAVREDTDTEGAPAVVVGELPLMHEASSEVLTIRTSELPPCRPVASVKKKIIEVPRATLVVHENDVGPTGGFRMKEFPPGIIA